MNSREAHIPVAAIEAASLREDCLDAVRELCIQVDRQIASYAPRCRNRGLCCRFGQFGHRLYVTTLEASYYLAVHGPPPGISEDACPHAYDGRCHVREARPFGCRIFHCDPEASLWQGPLTESCLARLRVLHTELAVPYVYADWMTVLDALGTLRAERGRP
jgi:hypothetical protein